MCNWMSGHTSGMTRFYCFPYCCLGMGSGDPGFWERQLSERAEHWLRSWPTFVGHLAVTLRVLTYE